VPTPTGDRPLEITDLTVEYTSGGYAVRPLDGFGARVESGELVLLLGASGCGKTTLLSALAAILTPTSGSIRLGDSEVVGLRGAALTRYRRETVGIVFQAFNLVPSLTALENVMLPMDFLGKRPLNTRRAHALELLTRVGVADEANRLPAGLSGGQQQRVAIARALANDPPVLIADEPTGNLDSETAEAVVALLDLLTDAGTTVLVATHDHEISRRATQRFTLCDGRFDRGLHA
jgi:putative ABC transport system ATP-binding protein